VNIPIPDWNKIITIFKCINSTIESKIYDGKGEIKAYTDSEVVIWKTENLLPEV
jgi:hypothetical protein